MKKFVFLTTFVVLFFIPNIAFASVFINEIAWMGTTNSANDEWIELYNDSDQQIDLTGWKLEAADGVPKINLSKTITANGYFLLERTDDDSVPGIPADQIYTGALVDGGEILELRNAENVLIDRIDCSGGWSKGDKNTRQTMERITTGWQTSANPGGTPKAQNSSGAIEEPMTEKPTTPPATSNNPPIAEAGDNIIGFVNQEIKFDGTQSSDPDGNELFCSWNMGDGRIVDRSSFTYKYLYPGTYLVTLTVSDGQAYTSDTISVEIQPAQIIINEFLPNPSGKDEEEEWVEIYNDSDSIVDISDWQLDDEASGSQPFTFPQNTLIAPKSYIVFSRQITGIALNNDKDSVRLLLPEGVIFQEINYEKPPQGKSSARTEEGFVWSMPTPGLTNIISPSTSSGLINKNFVYQQPVKPETTKESLQDYSWYYQNDFEKKIEGGFTVLPNEQESQSATVKQLSSNQNKQNYLNLFLLIIAIILFGAVIGLSLVKFHRKKPLPI